MRDLRSPGWSWTSCPPASISQVWDCRNVLPHSAVKCVWKIMLVQVSSSNLCQVNSALPEFLPPLSLLKRASGQREESTSAVTGEVFLQGGRWRGKIHSCPLRSCLPPAEGPSASWASTWVLLKPSVSQLVLLGLWTLPQLLVPKQLLVEV